MPLTPIQLQEIDLHKIAELLQGSGSDHFLRARLNNLPQALLMQHWWNHFEWRFLATVVPPGSIILDYGCGTGHSSVMLALNGFKLIGYEPDEYAARVARYVVSVNRADVTITERLPASDAFEFVWLSHVLEHIPKADWPSIFPYLAKCRGLLSVPKGHAYEDPGHVNHWAAVEDLLCDLREMLQISWCGTDEMNQVLRIKWEPKL
jgi:2-polyprenyl-3-methyl-5-hydroxy-6-metoxy-1,4-benzoquinol methylase